MKEEAVDLFQRFYTMENHRAPEAKRKRRTDRRTGGVDKSVKLAEGESVPGTVPGTGAEAGAEAGAGTGPVSEPVPVPALLSDSAGK